MSDEMMVQQSQGSYAGAGAALGGVALGVTGGLLNNKVPENWKFARENAYKSWDDIVADVSKEDSVILTQAKKDGAAKEVKDGEALAKTSSAAQKELEEAAGADLKGSTEIANYNKALENVEKSEKEMLDKMIKGEKVVVKAAEGETPAVEQTLVEMLGKDNDAVKEVYNKFKDAEGIKDKEFTIVGKTTPVKGADLTIEEAMQLKEFNEFAAKNEELTKKLTEEAKKLDVYKNIRTSNTALKDAETAVKGKKADFDFAKYSEARAKVNDAAAKGKTWFEANANKLTKGSWKKAAGIAAAAGLVLGGLIGACCKKNSEEVA